VASLLEAPAFATKLGLPFTRMITIHWQAAGVPPDQMVRATGKFIDLLSKALARDGAKTAWLFVHENGISKGAHCHLLIHVPGRLVAKITKLQRGWLRRISGLPYRARVIK
jgi:hypothetical protein